MAKLVPKKIFNDRPVIQDRETLEHPTYVRLSEAERELFNEGARKLKIPLSTYLRQCLRFFHRLPNVFTKEHDQ